MKTTPSDPKRALLILAALVAWQATLAGEYGLVVGPSFPNPCKREPSQSLNYCATAAVVQDLREHFISGKPFRLKAVEMAVLSGSISVSSDALPAFNEVIAAICVTESPHDFDTLKRFLHYLPYPSLRARLASEMKVFRRPAVTTRLRDALSALPAAPSVAAKAILAYKQKLYEAGDRDKCKETVERVGRAMAIDSRLSDADIQAEIDLYERVKGPIPYPSPGTACALFGFQEAAHAALDQRRTKPGR